MTKRIILLSDGTGNAAASIWRSNVWRIFQSLDLTTPNQVALYSDGVGTSAFKPLALLGGAFGWGLKRNVLDQYKFVCRNWEANAEIFAFGFSRGAFTVRVLMGLIAHQGLVISASEGELSAKAKEAYRAYRRERYHSFLGLEKPFRALRDAAVHLSQGIIGAQRYDQSTNREVEQIRFLGLWDTVAAYGLPVDEMTIGVSQYIWPLELPDRQLGRKVQRACHALSLDDERTTFLPVLWTEAGEQPAPAREGGRYLSEERLSQVWFAGVHANVGGGYPDDALAFVPLFWMMTHAAACGLEFKQAPTADPDAQINASSSRDKDGRLYNPRQGLGGYYRYGPRRLAALCRTPRFTGPLNQVEIAEPKIHSSAFERIRNGAHAYAPIGLPSRYAVVTEDGRILNGSDNPFENVAQATARASAQEKVWDIVWQRRIVYFLTVAASFHLVLFPLWYQTDRASEYSTKLRFISEALRIADTFIPNFFNWWLNAYAANPAAFAVGLGLVAILMVVGAVLETRIGDAMRGIWRGASQEAVSPCGWIFELRTAGWYQGGLNFLKWKVAPLLSALAIGYVVLSLGSHLIFSIADGAGLFCRESNTTVNVPWEGSVDAPKPFSVGNICWASGVRLEEGLKYAVIVTQSPPWKDGEFEFDTDGFEISERPTWRERVYFSALLPLRRVFLRPWLRLLGRIGAVGSDEYFLDPDKPSSIRKPRTDRIDVTFRARRGGEFFLYVNEAGLGLPWLSDVFYWNNVGEGNVTIKHLPR